MKATDFLEKIITDDDPHTDLNFVRNLAPLINADAVLNDGQQRMIRMATISGIQTGQYNLLLMSVATFINTCR